MFPYEIEGGKPYHSVDYEAFVPPRFWRVPCQHVYHINPYSEWPSGKLTPDERSVVQCVVPDTVHRAVQVMGKSFFGTLSGCGAKMR